MNIYELLHEDEDLVIVNKLAPLPVLKDKSGDEDLQSILKRELPSCGKFLEAAHRIDRRTSGIVVFAKNMKALQGLEEAFQNRSIHKSYIACLEKEPIPNEGTLKHTIVLDKKRNISIALPQTARANEEASVPETRKTVNAELSYRLILKTDRYYFVEAKPLTGRHHQIRAQFSAMGWPIKGDLKYEARRSTASGRIMLHARQIELQHPRTKSPLSVTAGFPSDETLWAVLGAFLESASPSGK